MTCDAQKKARCKYNAKRKRITIDFYPTENELFERIDKQPQKQTYIKDLIRAEMCGESLYLSLLDERKAELMQTKRMMESHERWKANHPRIDRTDFVKVVRCKNCAYYVDLPIQGECNYFSNEDTIHCVEPNGYCYHGVTKEGK